jgi:hypothetical protein
MLPVPWPAAQSAERHVCVHAYERPNAPDGPLSRAPRIVHAAPVAHAIDEDEERPPQLVSALDPPDDVRITDELMIHIAQQGAPPPSRKRIALPSLPDSASGRSAVAYGLGLLLVVVAIVVHTLRAPLFAPTFGDSGLVTNEYAARHPGSDAKRSDDWLVTSGSLIARDGWGWTGIPDGRNPGDRSTAGTDSAVFRAVSQRGDLKDVQVSFTLRNLQISRTPRTPAHKWDGVNLILRWHSPAQTYYVGLNRRDDQMVVKKKVAGGNVNGGWYYPLTEPQPYDVPFGRPQHIRATVTNDPDGAVTIKVYVDGRLRLHANDDGVGGPPISSAGHVGLRGDNDEFLFRDFVVRSTSSKQAGSGPTDQAPSDRSIFRKDRAEPTL